MYSAAKSAGPTEQKPREVQQIPPTPAKTTAVKVPQAQAKPLPQLQQQQTQDIRSTVQANIPQQQQHNNLPDLLAQQQQVQQQQRQIATPQPMGQQIHQQVIQARIPSQQQQLQIQQQMQQQVHNSDPTFAPTGRRSLIHYTNFCFMAFS